MDRQEIEQAPALSAHLKAWKARGGPSRFLSNEFHERNGHRALSIQARRWCTAPPILQRQLTLQFTVGSLLSAMPRAKTSSWHDP